MSDATPDATILLLPERRRLAGDPGRALARRLARAIAREGLAGGQAQLQRHFRIEPDGWPIAAILRQAEAGDAGDRAWLRADPVHLRAEMTGARLMAWGNLALAADDADAFIEELAPGFAEFGVDIGRTQPAHWYLRLPAGLVPPASTDPGDALGDDLVLHLRGGEAGRAWGRMLSDAQVALHHHPANAARIARGLPAINSTWFWGGGVHPARVRSHAAAIDSREPQLRALALAAGHGGDEAGAGGAGDTPCGHGDARLLDLRHLRSWADVGEGFLRAVPGRECHVLVFDFADGQVLSSAPPAWWQFWTRA
jgi:hypothetical protein